MTSVEGRHTVEGDSGMSIFQQRFVKPPVSVCATVGVSRKK
ncbi:hypothetical protein VRK_12290 [Vibrio sp. MEBiC08052]|nr:hypothetical protein VRK_12290 [Vibrio sp. MEBiC08052]